MNETRDIHPLVVEWLIRNGYSYIHEYKLPDYGIVDFYATHADGHILLVEAKGKRLAKVLTQLAGYGVQVMGAFLAVAAPEILFIPKIEKIANKHNIRLIKLDIEPNYKDSENAPSPSLALVSTFHRLDFVEGLAKAPEQFAVSIIEACDSPMSKIVTLWAMHELVSSYCVAAGREDNTAKYFVSACLDIANDIENLQENPLLVDITKSILSDGSIATLIRYLALGWHIPPMDVLFPTGQPLLKAGK